MHFALENRFKPGLNQYFGVNYVNLAGESQFGLWPALRFGSRLPRQFAKVRVEDRLWVGSLLTTTQNQPPRCYFGKLLVKMFKKLGEKA